MLRVFKEDIGEQGFNYIDETIEIAKGRRTKIKS